MRKKAKAAIGSKMPADVDVVCGLGCYLVPGCKPDLHEFGVGGMVGSRFPVFVRELPNIADDSGFPHTQPVVREEAEPDDIALEGVIAVPEGDQTCEEVEHISSGKTALERGRYL